MQALLSSGVFVLFLMAQLLAVMALRGHSLGVGGPPDRRRETTAVRPAARHPGSYGAAVLVASGL